ncbi:putative membrane protein [Mycobacterium xenopi 4042]|uniref:Putative membrane protein n=1 Tax=Mycobacterium xenopi 4042 TaxID=1299334 RepID=X8CAL4_MYCXE|nr:putative membrane protein [Mycobacterium xenopi 4042]
MTRLVRRWNVVVPLLALVALALTWGRVIGSAAAALTGMLLAGAVLAAVHHAEVVAHRVGEPFGSLVLAVAVTIIEVALIVTLMVSGGDKSATLARDTVFAAVIITTNGIVGLSLLIGSLRYGVMLFNANGSGAALATVTTLATLSLVLPTFTTSQPGPEFSPGQLSFAALASLGLYLLFVFTQTVRHRDFFLPVSQRGATVDESQHAPPPTARRALASLALLLAALVAVVGLAKVESPVVERAVTAIGFPQSFVGVVIAMLVLLPKHWRPCGRHGGPHPNQPQPGLRLGDGQHRAHHPRDRAGLAVAQRPAAAGPGCHPVGAAGADRRGRCADRRARPRHPATGRGASGAAGRIRVSRGHPVRGNCPAMGAPKVTVASHSPPRTTG